MKQHILVISQYFHPEEFRINDICKEWIKRGYQVTVVTGIPNYPQGRFYKNYSWFKKRKEVYKGIKIIRLPIIPRGNNSLMLVLNYLSFVVSGFLWELLTRVRADKVFIFEVSPMTQALVGVWYAQKRKIPCCIYVQDLWPENVEAVVGIKNRQIIGGIDKMVNYIYRNCSVILTTSPSFVRRIEERKAAWDSVGLSKVKYWPQYAEEFYVPVERKPLQDMPEDDAFKIVFTGNIGYAQGLNILPPVAERLKERKVNCRFVIIGDGRYRTELEKALEERNVKDMFWILGRKTPKEIPQYLAHCDIAFVSFAENPLFSMTIPAKLQSYIACGMPVLAVASGETQRIVEEAECGWVVPMGDIDRLVEAIIAAVETSAVVCDKMRANALVYCYKYFNKEHLIDISEHLWGNMNANLNRDGYSDI